MLKLIQPNLKAFPSDRLNLRQGDFVPNFALPRNVVSDGVLANLRCLLTERGGRVPGDVKRSAFLSEHFRASFADNLKECLQPTPKFAGDAVNSLRGATSPGIKIESQSLYLSVFRNIRDIIVPPKAPPLELTSKPIQVPEIWSKQKTFSGSRTASAILHVGLIAAAMAFSVREVTTLDPPKSATVLIAPPAPGGAPPPPARVTTPTVNRRTVYTKRKSFFVQGKLTAPNAIPKVVSAKHTVDVGVPDLSLGDASGDGPTGVPGGVLGGVTGGIPGGMLGGIPSPSAPPPPGATTPALVRVGGDVKRPKAIYAPAPEFPSIARKANITGAVILQAVIDEHGNVVKLQRVEGNGFLVAAALKAVSRWKFEPSYLNGVPISVEMEITVTFHYVSH